MRGLSIADQQMVEIARALLSDSRLIIMDEPTAPLTPKEVDKLFEIARQLRDDGRTIIFISHRLEEVRALCDRVTIFRDGNRIATERTAALEDDDIIRLMIGREVKSYLHKTGAELGEVALAVSGLTLPGKFEGISFTVRAGEVVGLGGLVGAGRTDVARAISTICWSAIDSPRIGLVTSSSIPSSCMARSALRLSSPQRTRLSGRPRSRPITRFSATDKSGNEIGS
jgi:rhamnose transport system ATP-binding protein